MTRSKSLQFAKHFGPCILTGLVIFLILVAWQLPGGLELKVTLVKENKNILALPLKEKEMFTIHYYHSVENAPIWESHSMDGKGNLFIEEEKYERFGAGMGKMPGVGRMVMEGPYEVIKDMHMPTGDFVLRVGSVGVDHTLIWRNNSFNLSEKYAHKAVQFSGRPIGLFQYMILNSKIFIKHFSNTEVKNG